ncbi:MAG: hypothetical protein WKF37_21215 [Bryobacteraceae bacterium]
MEPQAAHLHTYFLFPFSIDKQAVVEDHAEIWVEGRSWFDGVDDWVKAHAPGNSAGLQDLGRWERAAYRRFDMDSEAY